jgi:N-acetylglutamate synthase-like GNAT family acetyltransferase
MNGIVWSGSAHWQLREWLLFADKLQREEKGCLGFLPRSGLEEWWKLGRVVSLFKDGELIGYAAGRICRRVCRFFQVAVRRDARRIEHGMALVAAWEKKAREQQAVELSLWCAADIEAVLFWEALQFQVVGQRYKSRLVCRPQYQFVRSIKHGLHKPAPIVRRQLFGGVLPTRPLLLSRGAVGGSEFEQACLLPARPYK